MPPTPEPGYDLASTVICSVLAQAAESPVNHGRTADMLITEMGKAGLLAKPTKGLAEYQPASPVGDLLALKRAEYWALAAERYLPSSWALERSKACAQIAQSWAMIGLIYQGPGEGTSPERFAHTRDDQDPHHTQGGE